MGQSHSEEKHHFTREQLAHNLAIRFLRNSFSEIEVYSFKDNFESLAQVEATSGGGGGGNSSAYPAHSHSQNGQGDNNNDNNNNKNNNNSKILYWTEDTLTRFLGLPDALDPVGSILYQSATYLGAFPFEDSLAPVALTFEALVKVVVLMTGRHTKVIKRKNGHDKIDTVKLLWRSFAVWERVIDETATTTEEGQTNTEADGAGDMHQQLQEALREEDVFMIGGDDEDGYEDDDDDEDDLTMAALKAMDAVEAMSFTEDSRGTKDKPRKQGKYGKRIQTAHIPVDNLRKLIMLLLLISPLEPTQPLAVFVDRCTGEGLVGLRNAAENVLNAFTDGDKSKRGVGWRQFKAVMKRSTPYLFDGFSPLFEHLLFSKNLNMAAASKSPVALTRPSPTDSVSPSSPAAAENEGPNILDLTQPLLATPGDILNVDVVSQLSLFIKGSNLWRRLRLLYAGSQAGFSMGSFETKVLKWHAPTILLVSGTRMSDPPANSREKAFCETLPSRRYPSSRRRKPKKTKTTSEGGDVHGDGDGDDADDGDDTENESVVFGVYLNVPWKLSHKENFGDASTLLFQLEPVHEVFLPSKVATSYCHFNKTDGIAFGNEVSHTPAAYKLPHGHSSPHTHRAQQGAHVHLNLGPVSLTFDENLEFGVFNHTGEGGAFLRSETRRVEGEGLGLAKTVSWGSVEGEDGGGKDERVWQDRFRIDEIEVWGCGGDKEADEQRRNWEWEEREALLRRSVSLGKDLEADRALLEMAGLIGQNRSGGSMM
ncbi:TLD-domain-containing protein [Peziza echinospora]|nr:TLD-domain-containing protein [Peziza echinospora]